MLLRLPRRRTLAKAAACILAGAVVNVGVAWACAARPYLTRVQFVSTSDWIDTAAPWIGGENWRLRREVAIGVSQLIYYAHNPTLETPEGETSFAMCRLDLFQSGLPFRSMEWRSGGCATRSPNGVLGPGPDFTGGYKQVRKPWNHRHRVMFPLLPIASGFAANTAVYAAGLLSVLFAPTAIRRRRRRNHGLCPACGYDTAGLTDCPECGAAGKD